MNSLIASAVLFYLVFRSEDLKGRLQLFAVALMLGGSMGNLADRVFRGGVVDFVSAFSFPVFNLADAALTASGVLIVWFWASGYYKRTFELFLKGRLEKGA